MQVLRGAILIPAGVYRITKTLDTRKSLVFRGAGKTLTTLYFPFSLTEVYGNTWTEVRLSCPVVHLLGLGPRRPRPVPHALHCRRSKQCLYQFALHS